MPHSFPSRHFMSVAVILLSFAALPLSAQPYLDGRWDNRFAEESEGGLGFIGDGQALAVDPTSGDIYAAGRILRRSTTIPNRWDYVLRWTGEDWESTNDSFNNTVNAIIVGLDGTLYAGGRFTEANDGSSFEGIAQFDGDSWSALGMGTDGTVRALAVDPVSGDLFVGGDFDAVYQADGTAVPSPTIARWTGSEWEQVGFGGDGQGVYSIAFDPITNDLFVGGRLWPGMRNNDSTLVAVDDVARFDGSTWTALTDDNNRLSVVNAIGFDASGNLYIAHEDNYGFAVWDRDEISTPAGGVGETREDGQPERDEALSLLVTDNLIYVGGAFDRVRQADGSGLDARGVAAYDPATNSWSALGEGISGVNFHQVFALAVRDSELFAAGKFNQAGALPSSGVGRWTTQPPAYPQTFVTFQVDMAPIARKGLLHNVRSDNPTSHRPVLRVYDGPDAGGYFLYDYDVDSVWTARIPQPANTTITYDFAFDISGDGYDSGLGGDWIEELAAATRSASLTSAPEHTLPAVSYDNRPLLSVDQDYAYRAQQKFRGGFTDRQRFPSSGQGGVIFIDMERIDNTSYVSVRWYTKDPGGAPPEGIVTRSVNSFWVIDVAPIDADFEANVTFEYTAVPGVEEPADLRLLYRADATQPWKLVDADVNVADQLIEIPLTTNIQGEWTLGSVSAVNALSNDPPGVVSNPTPSDGSLAAPIRPLFEWDAPPGGRTYDLYLWEASEAEPTNARRINFDEPRFQETQELNFGESYNWRVVARNINGETEGPVWSFTVGSVSDLTVTSIETPAEAFSRQEIEVSWTVENTGDGGTNVPVWYDEVFISESPDFDPETAASIGRFKNLSFLDRAESYANTQTVTLPDGIQGTQYVHVFTDAPERRQDRLDEIDESNNMASAAVEVTLAPFADLRVESVVVPGNVFSGDSIDVQFTVQNFGTGRTDVDQWEDSIFLSEDDVFDFIFSRATGILRFDDTPLGSTPYEGVLEAGESYVASARVKLPDEAIGDFTLFVFTDTGTDRVKQSERGSVYEFNVELNNWEGAPLEITLTPPPDLVVTDVQAPAAAESGEQVDLTWTVRNQGPGATRSDVWTDVIYYSPTAAFDSSTAVPLGGAGHTGVLAVDAAYTGERRVRIPDGVSGDGYFFVAADGLMRVFEHTFDDNNRGGSTEAADVSRAPYPDLQVSRVSVAPAAVTAGDQVALTYTVENNGTAAAGRNWIDSVFVSGKPTWDPFAATALFRYNQSSGLAAGASREQTVAVTLPADLDGTAYLYVKSDAGDRLFEFPDAEPNVGRSGAITAGAYPPVNLAAAIESIPETATTGRSIKLQIRITNTGDGATLADEWFDEVYLSLNDTLDKRSDRSLQLLEHEGILAGGAGYTYTIDVALPEDISGDVFLFASADAEGEVPEVDESDNVAVAPLSVALTPPADLRAMDIIVPLELQAGQPLNLQWTITNEGDGPTRSSADGSGWFDAVYLSFDRVIDADDALLGTRKRTAGLAAGESYTDSLRAVAPAYASGAYYLVVQTDLRDDVYEHLAEGDNLTFERVDLTLPPPSDLTVAAIDVPEEAVPGEEVSVSWTVENIGDNPARGFMREAVFVSADAVWDPDDVLLGVAESEINITAGGSTSSAMKVDLGRSFKINAAGEITEVLPGVEPGDYYVIVRTDIGNTIRETDDSNNTGVSESTVETDVQELLPGVPITETYSAGQSRYYRLDVAEGEDLRISISSDEPDASNELYVSVGETPTAGGEADFASAEPFTDGQVVVIPSTEPGTYFVQVVTRSLPTGAEGQQLMILAELLGFEITSAAPGEGGQGQVTTRLEGAGFRATDRIFLRNGAGDEVQGRIVDAGSTTGMTVRYELHDAVLGTWDLVVARADGSQEAVLAEGFEVREATEPTVTVEKLIPEAFRDGGRAVMVYRYTNTGNVDIQYLEAQLQMLDTPDLRVHTSDGLLKMSDIFPPPDTVEVWHDYVLSSDTVYIVPLLARNVPPGSELEATFTTSTGSPGVYLFSDFAEAITAEEYLRKTIDDLLDERNFILENAAGLDPETVAQAADVDEWITSNLQRFVDAGLMSEELAASASVGGGAALATHVAASPVQTADNEALLSEATAAPVFGGSLDAILAQTDLGSSSAYEIMDGSPSEETPEEICARGRPRAITKSCLNKHKACDCVRNIQTRCFPFFDMKRSEDFQKSCDDQFANCEQKMKDSRKLDSSSPTTPNNCDCRPRITPCDPNDIIGPEAWGDENWVSFAETLPYIIRFENDPELARAPAQVVRINHMLDSDLDVRSFRLGDFGFGPFTFSPPANSAHYRDRLDVVDSLGVFVDVTAGIDVLSGEAFWAFTSIDPATGDQPRDDPFAGFLPINNEQADGEGFVSFTVRPNLDAETGDVIDAQASIVFDLNAPIDTPPIFNTIDADGPRSRVSILASRQDSAAFNLHWEGLDIGAGVRAYALYVSRDDGPFERYADELTSEDFLFVGELGVTNRFFVIAEDYAGNVESLKTEGEAVTAVPIEDDGARDLPDSYALHQNYPNPFNPATTIPFDLPEAAEVRVAIFNALGQRVLLVEDNKLAAGRYRRQVDLSRFASGVYFYEIQATGVDGENFRALKKLVLVK